MIGKICFAILCGLILAGLVVSHEVYAKEVKIEWKSIEGAIGYDLELQPSAGGARKTHLKFKTPESRWKGEIPAGAYAYQIRGIDRVNRPGQWSRWKPLAVMPEPPLLKVPEDGKRIDHYNPALPVNAKWESPPGFQKFRVELKKDGKTALKALVDQSEYLFQNLEAGKYTWEVRPVLELKGIPGLAAKSWDSPKSVKAEFELRNLKMSGPELIKPLGTTSPSDDRMVTLKWDRVEGAEGYEVHLVRVPKDYLVKSGGRAPASTLKASKFHFTKEPSLRVPAAENGHYVWGVRALAHLNSASENHGARAISSESVGRFSLDPNAVYGGDLGYLAVSAMIAPYTYEITNPGLGIHAASQSLSVVGRLSGEYWFTPLWGISLAGEMANFQISNKPFTRPNLEILAKYRTQLSSGKYGWSFSPKLGAELRDYNEITPTVLTSGSAVTVRDIFVLGAAAGFDLRKQFSESFSLGTKFAYFYPLKMLDSGSAIADSTSYRNLSCGIQGVYWLTKSLAVGAGGYFEWRSIGLNNASNPVAAEKIGMDGTYFFTSLIYRFWR